MWSHNDEISAHGVGEANRTCASRRRCTQNWGDDAEDPCAAQVKRAKTIMGLNICVLEDLDDVFNEPPETPTNLAGTPGENETDEDVVSPEVTEELNRLKTLGRPYTAPSADELMPRTFVYRQKTNEQLDKRMVAEGRERELDALCSQNALFVISRTAMSPGTKMVRGRFVDDMKNGRVKSRFMAAEVARDVRRVPVASETMLQD